MMALAAYCSGDMVAINISSDKLSKYHGSHHRECGTCKVYNVQGMYPPGLLLPLTSS